MVSSETRAGSVERRRVVVAFGARRHDAAFPLGISLGLALECLGLDLSAPGIVVIGSNGDRLDPTETVGKAVVDGSLITVLELRPLAASVAQSRRTDGTKSVRQLRSWWCASAFAVVVIIIAALGYLGVGEPVGAGEPFGSVPFGSVPIDSLSAGSMVAASDGALSPLIRIITSLCLAVLALIALLATTRDGARGQLASALTAPPLLAFAAAFVAIDPALTGAVHLATLAGLLAATVAVALVHVRRLGLYSLGATGLVLVILLILAALWGGALMMEMPATVAAALVTGFAPLALRILPTTCLEVPPGHLIEYPQLMTTLWTVRGRTPDGSRPVTGRAVGGMIGNAQEQLIVGTIIFSALPALMMPFVFLGAAQGNQMVQISAIVLAGTVVLSLGFSPRTATLPVLRWLPRAGAAVVLVELGATLVLVTPAELLVLITVGILAVGIIAAIGVIPVSRGTVSISMSRSADLIEGLATILALPAGFVAANLITILQGMASA